MALVGKGKERQNDILLSSYEFFIPLRCETNPLKILELSMPLYRSQIYVVRLIYLVSNGLIYGAF